MSFWHYGSSVFEEVVAEGKIVVDQIMGNVDSFDRDCSLVLGSPLLTSKKRSRLAVRKEGNSKETEWRWGKGRRSQAILTSICSGRSKVLSLICHSLAPLSLEVHLYQLDGWLYLLHSSAEGLVDDVPKCACVWSVRRKYWVLFFCVLDVQLHETWPHAFSLSRDTAQWSLSVLECHGWLGGECEVPASGGLSLRGRQTYTQTDPGPRQRKWAVLDYVWWHSISSGRGTLLFNFAVWSAEINGSRNPKNDDSVLGTRSNYL